MIVSEQFEKLAKLIIKSQRVPESIAIMIKGNPEYITDGELAEIADGVLLEAVKRFTTPHGD